MNAMKFTFLARTTALILLVLAAAPAAAADNSVAGHWEIQGTPDGAPGPAFTNLALIGKEGGITNLDPWFGTGLGKWERIGGNLFAVTFTHYFLDGPDVGEVTVTGTLSLSEDKDSVSGDFATEISIGGLVVQYVTGTIAGSRQ